MQRIVSFRDFDWVLMAFVLAICSLGVVEIYSATLHTKFVGAHVRQIYWIIAGIFVMIAASRINYQALLENVPWMYILSLISLIAVLVFGQKYLGARRWIRIGGSTHFQPSEWVKLILILAMAKYFSDNKYQDMNFVDLLKAGSVVGVPMLLVLVQPDLGTALTYAPIAIMGLFLGGMKFRHAAIILICAAIVAIPAYKFGLKQYQKDRIQTFVNPDVDPQKKGYQSIQSDRGRFGRPAGQGNHERLANTGIVPAGDAHGLHLCGLLGRTWFCGCNGGVTAILYGADEVDTQRSDGARPRRSVCGDGCGSHLGVSHHRQCRHGGRFYAGRRDSLAVDELRRVVRFVHVPCVWDCDECPHAPVRELGFYYKQAKYPPRRRSNKIEYAALTLRGKKIAGNAGKDCSRASLRGSRTA